MSYTYILFSRTLDRFYIGSTRDEVSQRLHKHLSEHDGFTSKAKDWEVVYTEEFIDYRAALARERTIKSWKSRRLIERLITKT